MNHHIRTPFLGLAFTIGTLAHAQPTPPYDITITGWAAGCEPGTYIEVISAPGTLPEINEVIPLGSFCDFQVTYQMESPLGSFVVLAYCGGNPQFVQEQVDYMVNFLGSDTIGVTLDCGLEPPCEACFTWEQATEAGSVVPFTVDLTNCTVEVIPPYTYTWIFPDGTATTTTDATYTFPGPGQYYISLYASGDSCSASSSWMISASPDGTLSTFPPAGCTACFSALQNTVLGQPVPFTAILDNCSYGDQSVQYLWTLPDGTTSTLMDDVLYTFPGAGTYVICLSIADNDGCNSTFCDSIFVDADGNISNAPNGPVDCLQVPNGPAMPGTPCITFANEPGTWNTNCVCIPNTPSPCEAGFWVIQAYDLVTIGNDTSMAVPIPFELWIWNLSSGGTGNYQFVWDFGDGNSSTEPYPTHVYAAAGPYNLCLTMTDDAGCTSTFCEQIEVDQDGLLGMSPGAEVRSALTINVLQVLPTGVAEQSTLTGINLWPNPVQDQFNLTINSSRSGTLEFVVLDLNGRLLLTSSAALANGKNQVQVDVNGLESGMYLLRMAHGQQSRTLRFVKH